MHCRPRPRLVGAIEPAVVHPCPALRSTVTPQRAVVRAGIGQRLVLLEVVSNSRGVAQQVVDGDVGRQVAGTAVGWHHLDDRGAHRDTALRHLVEHRGRGQHLGHRCGLVAGGRRDGGAAGAVGEAEAVLDDGNPCLGEKHRARHTAEFREPPAQAGSGRVVEELLGHTRSMPEADGQQQ